MPAAPRCPTRPRAGRSRFDVSVLRSCFSPASGRPDGLLAGHTRADCDRSLRPCGLSSICRRIMRRASALARRSAIRRTRNLARRNRSPGSALGVRLLPGRLAPVGGCRDVSIATEPRLPMMCFPSRLFLSGDRRPANSFSRPGRSCLTLIHDQRDESNKATADLKGRSNQGYAHATERASFPPAIRTRGDSANRRRPIRPDGVASFGIGGRLRASADPQARGSSLAGAAFAEPIRSWV